MIENQCKSNNKFLQCLSRRIILIHYSLLYTKNPLGKNPERIFIILFFIDFLFLEKRSKNPPWAIMIEEVFDDTRFYIIPVTERFTGKNFPKDKQSTAHRAFLSFLFICQCCAPQNPVRLDIIFARNERYAAAFVFLDIRYNRMFRVHRYLARSTRIGTIYRNANCTLRNSFLPYRKQAALPLRLQLPWNRRQIFCFFEIFLR